MMKVKKYSELSVKLDGGSHDTGHDSCVCAVYKVSTFKNSAIQTMAMNRGKKNGEELSYVTLPGSLTDEQDASFTTSFGAILCLEFRCLKWSYSRAYYSYPIFRILPWT